MRVLLGLAAVALGSEYPGQCIVRCLKAAAKCRKDDACKKAFECLPDMAKECKAEEAKARWTCTAIAWEHCFTGIDNSPDSAVHDLMSCHKDCGKHFMDVVV
mmetsp:Transcript_28898/g.63650  ORF Transcript_28898/g.63650 Transcript_28898/m.63650 type:complete len:102 (+) Transcript_28898:54-359(+)|eukprot:CAMPEP_0204275952 /NCGR_PEP_ID=MMETSP0468-20130131/27009_1 /ASSEMBLY_ACC=CAM_ASM_000383 /TAXON_ID=2969 /ORGANISM="Oxyrrhis marina" /LENGTH=101 /DNA_ID=CAMNT_0051252425 /DNA_START=38 /DNA_END=343 /DNA_ORIENTATION=+